MGIGCSGPRWTVVVRHLPTGFVVTRTSDQFRSQHMARESAMRYMRSLLYIDGFKEDDCEIKEEGDV